MSVSVSPRPWGLIANEQSTPPLQPLRGIGGSSSQDCQSEEERLRRLDAMGQMSGSIAHDFNNILGTIMPSLQLALHRSHDPNIRALLERALEATKNGASLSRRLLSVARPQPDLEEDVSVSEICAVVRDVAHSRIEKSIRVRIAPVDTDLAVRCDRAQLETVLVNLLFNARDAILADGVEGQIDLTVQRDEASTGQAAQIRITVEDDGPGMPPDVKFRSMEPFFTTRARGEGSGLGLSIAYGFCRQAGGSLDIRSTPGEGTAVTISLPLLASLTTALSDADLWVPGNGQRLLIAEAEDGLRRSLADVMTELGYDAVIVDSGKAALRELAQSSFDILLTDVQMPGGMTGFELAVAVRSSRIQIPVIYMSGRSVAKSDRRITIPGPILRKPCGISDLSRIISSELNAKRTTGVSTVTAQS